MKYLNIIAAAAVAFAAAPAFAGQLAANAGLSPAEAQGLSLTEIAQAKFNRDTRGDDRHPVVVIPGSGGDYTQLAAVAGVSPEGKSLNRDLRGEDQPRGPRRRAAGGQGRRRDHDQPVGRRAAPPTTSSRPAPASPRPTRRA